MIRNAFSGCLSILFHNHLVIDSSSQVSGCSIAPPGTADIIELLGAVKGMVENAHALIETVGDMDLDRLGEICGLTTAQAAAFNSLVTLAHDATHVVNRALIGLREVLECETFNPIYQVSVVI